MHKNYKIFIILFIFAVLVPFVGIGQYYEFTWNSTSAGNHYTWFQQWCSEQYDIYFDTEWVTWITVW